MNLVRPHDPTTPPAIDSFDAIRAFAQQYRAELKAGNLEALRPLAASLAPHYHNLVARLKRAQARTGRSAAELGFSPCIDALAPLFAEERKEGWLNKILRSAASL